MRVTEDSYLLRHAPSYWGTVTPAWGWSPGQPLELGILKKARAHLVLWKIGDYTTIWIIHLYIHTTSGQNQYCILFPVNTNDCAIESIFIHYSSCSEPLSSVILRKLWKSSTNTDHQKLNEECAVSSTYSLTALSNPVKWK